MTVMMSEGPDDITAGARAKNIMSLRDRELIPPLATGDTGSQLLIHSCCTGGGGSVRACVRARMGGGS